MNIGSLIVSIGGDVAPLRASLQMAKTEMDKANTAMISSIEKLNASLKKTGDTFIAVGKTMTMAVTLPIVAAGGFAIKMASDFNESLNKVDVAFKESSVEVKMWAKTTLKAFGIAEGSALDMAALFGDMGTSMGFTTKEAAKMSISLVSLAGDLASFKNIGMDQATTALNGVFTGETESLKRLGIVMTEANLTAYAMSTGIRQNIQDMTQAEKVQLRYSYVMNITKNSQGDFARTQGGAANQMRIFKESMKQAGATLGQILLPLFTKIVTKINELIQAFTSLSPQTQKIIVVIAGVAAAIGPLLIGIGGLLKLIPLMAAGGATLSAAWLPVTVAILAVAAAIDLVISNQRKWDNMVGKKAETSLTALKEELKTRQANLKAMDEESAILSKQISENQSTFINMEGTGTVSTMDTEKYRTLSIRRAEEVEQIKAITEAIKLKTEAEEEEITAAILAAKAAKTVVVTPVTPAAVPAAVPALSSYRDSTAVLKNMIKEPISEAIFQLASLSQMVDYTLSTFEGFGSTVTLKVTEAFNGMNEKIGETKQVLVDLGAELQELATGAIINLAEGLGTMLSGGKTEEVLRSFLNMVAEWAMKLGGLMIAAGVAASGFWKALMSGPAGAVAAIGLGVALVAAGALVKGAMKAPGSRGSSGMRGGPSGGDGMDLTGTRQLQQFQVVVSGQITAKGTELVTIFENENRRKGF